MDKKFTEENISQNIKKITILLSILIFIVSGCGIIAIIVLKDADQASKESQINAIMNEYLKDMEQRFETDLKSLTMLSMFVGGSDRVNGKNFVEGLDKLQENNLFYRIGYYSIDGIGTRVTFSENIEEITFSKLHDEIKEIIRQAWNGEDGVSNIYYLDEIESSVISYAVPVYKDGEIIGSLAATKTIDVFDEILNNVRESHPNLDIDWIKQNGDFLTWSKNSILKEKIDNIFDGDYIVNLEKERIKKALDAGKSYTSSLVYNYKSYDIYFTPMKYNNWYLLYLNKLDNTKTSVSIALMIVIGVLIVIIFLTIFIFLFGYYLIKKSNSDIMDLAFYDPLTGCYNFEKFKKELVHKLSEKKKYCLVTLNIRDFQYINDIIGMKKADEILYDVAKMLDRHLEGDEIYCRSNADQFYFLLYFKTKEEIERKVYHIMNRISDRVKEKNINYPVTLYSGVANIQDDGDATELAIGLLHRAEFAQKQIVKSYDNKVSFYDESMKEKENIEKYVTSNGQKALENEEFKLYLQPKFNLQTNVLDEAEVLVRWIREDGTMVYPDQFIPVFEKNGFCVELDLYMFEKSCQLLAKWREKGYAPVRLSVNQSRLLLYQSDYINTLDNILKKYDIPKDMIQLEILEGVAVENIMELNKVFKNIHKLGLRLALDDFGTGYSSLNILSGIDVDEIKFDKQFLLEKDEEQKEKSNVMVKGLVELIGNFSMSTVVEGVETKEDEEFIRRIGCTLGQGYYYNAPIPIEKFEKEYLL